jgi:hypothetical protein
MQLFQDHNMMQITAVITPNVAVEWLTLLIRNLEVLDSQSETSCHVLCSLHQDKRRDSASNCVTSASFHILSN